MEIKRKNLIVRKGNLVLVLLLKGLCSLEITTESWVSGISNLIEEERADGT